VVVVVDSDAELHGDGDGRAAHTAHGGGHELTEEAALERNGRAATASGDLGDWTAEVHVDVVGHALVGDHPRRRERGLGVDGVQLQRARRLVGRERRHVHRDRVPLDKCTGSDHFAHVEAAHCAGAGQLQFAAERPERHVRHAGHGRQHDWAAQRDRPDLQTSSGRLADGRG
jgi:hypothetical protein